MMIFMTILKWVRGLFSRKPSKLCIKCGDFASLDDKVVTLSYGFCKTLELAVYKHDTGCEDFKTESNPKSSKDPHAPRGKNTPYPNDEFGRVHMEKWLDDIYWKHHG